MTTTRTVRQGDKWGMTDGGVFGSQFQGVDPRVVGEWIVSRWGALAREAGSRATWIPGSSEVIAPTDEMLFPYDAWLERATEEAGQMVMDGNLGVMAAGDIGGRRNIMKGWLLT